MKYIIQVFLLLLISTATFAQTAEVKEKMISLDEKNYHIDYPANWDLDQSRAGAEFFIFSKLTGEEDKLKENINLIIQDLSGHNIKDLDAFVTLSENQVKTILKGVKILSSERVKSENSEFQKLLYSGEMGVYNLTFLQYYWVENNKAYVLTFTSETTQYDQYKDLALQILDSFKIKN